MRDNGPKKSEVEMKMTNGIDLYIITDFYCIINFNVIIKFFFTVAFYITIDINISIGFYIIFLKDAISLGWILSIFCNKAHISIYIK